MSESVVTPFPLERHTPRISLDWLHDEPDTLWKLVEGSAVFADISGFTALSERLATRGRIGAEELVETLTRVFGTMLDTAASRGGQLLKFGGDALLFLFDGDDHVRQACSTAVEMRSSLRSASDIVTSVGRLSLSISIGVHSGEFHNFLVGHPHRELVVLGPGTTAVVGAENEANAGDIVVSEGTAQRLPASAVRDRGDGALLLRWRKAPVEPSGELATRPDDHDAAVGLLPAVLREALDGVRPDPAHRVATVSFMKFSGTDAILEELGPDVLAQRLHDTISVAQAAFEAEDIALLCVDCDVDGGKLFSSAGIPVTSEDDEGRMLRAARAVLEAQTPLGLQIGVNRGHVFAAEIGTPRRCAYSAMGDTTNTAARICGKSEKGAIFVHPAVLEHSRVTYEAEPVGPFEFKGKTHPQLLYRLGDEIGQREDDRDDDAPLLGRDDEADRLRERLAASVGPSARGSAVVLNGGVGVGKSRLARQVIDEALDDDPSITVMSLHAEPYGANSPYRIFRDPIRSILEVERGANDDMARQLRETATRLIPDLEALLALAGDVAHVPIEPSEEVDAILPRYRADRTADVIIELLAASTPGRLVLTVEDGHWADDASAHLVERLARETSHRPWTIIVTRRDEPGGVELDDADAIEIQPFDSDTMRSLVVAMTEAAPLRPHEVDQIVERAGGNPLFAKELILAIQELGSLDAVPTSLQGAMAAQVDALDPLSKRVLSYASVLGRSFRRTVIREVLEGEQIELDPASIDRLSRFIEADGPERFRFRNGLVRDVTYDGLGFHLRERLHLQAGNAAERLSDGGGADADTLSLHFTEGGDHERAYKYSVIAAERAERANATTDAANSLERALAAARRTPDLPDEDLRQLWIRLGDVRDQAGLLEDALAAYRSAAKYGDGPVEQAELLLRRASVRVRAGAFSAALREATRVRRLLERSQEREARSLRARAMSFSAVVRQRQERTADGMQMAQRAIAEAEACDERTALARAHGVMSWAGLVLGQSDATHHAEVALELFEEVGDLVGQAHMANNLGSHAYFEGEWDETLGWYARCERACRQTGNVTDAALANANTGEVLVNQNRLDEAEPLLRDAARVLRVSHHLWGATFAEMYLGRLLMLKGDLEAAEELLRAVTAENAEMGSSASAYESALHLGQCLVEAGRPAEALQLVADYADKTDDDITIFDAGRAIVDASALIQLGRIDEAADVIVAGVAAARTQQLEFDLARLLQLAVEIGRQNDERLGTDDAGAEASRLFDRLGVRTEVSV